MPHIFVRGGSSMAMPDWVRYYPNITTSLSVAPPSGGWSAMTIAAIYNTGHTDRQIIGSENWILLEQKGFNIPRAAAGNGSSFFPWFLEKDGVNQARNQLIVSRTLAGAWASLNGVTASVSGRTESPVTANVTVRSDIAQLKAVAVWNRALTPDEQTAALTWLNAQAPA